MFVTETPPKTSPTRAVFVTAAGDIGSMHGDPSSRVSMDWTVIPTGWELHGPDGRTARLSQAERGWRAEAGGVRWTLHRVGFHRPRMVLRPEGALAEEASLVEGWGGVHAVHFVSGPSWELDMTHRAGAVLRDAEGRELARLTWDGRFDAPGARVQTEAALFRDRRGQAGLLLTGFAYLDALTDPARHIALGVPFGHTARARFS